ncbi:MAG: hypothetical protein CSB47_09785 [Proteobacteria bacterium]|nr:MAG: hypothetical protein CSB47_09785 [Pseudomonadota bacterium]
MSFKFFLKRSLLLLASIPLVAQADWPVATPDHAEATTASSISIPVLQNDTGNGLELVKVDTTSKKGGEVSINTDRQTVTYQSAADFTGTDSFWYDFEDEEGRTNSARVTITVTASDEGEGSDDAWPVATPDDETATTSNPTIISVLQNDTGVGLTLTEVDTSSKQGGAVSINAGGQTVTYQSAEDFEGTDTFWYSFKDSQGRTNAARVTVVVQAGDEVIDTDQAVAVADHYVVRSSLSRMFDVLENDAGNLLKVVSRDERSEHGGKLDTYAQRYIDYTSKSGFEGVDSFRYTIKDAEGRTSTTKVTITVLPATTPTPITLDDAVTTPKDRPIRIDVLKNDIFSPYKQGEISELPDTSDNGGTIEKVVLYTNRVAKHEQLIYTPPTGFSGTDSFTYTAKNAESNETGTAKVTIEVSESDEFTTPFPTTNPDNELGSCGSTSCSAVTYPLRNDRGENLILKLDSAWSLKGAKVFLRWIRFSGISIIYEGTPEQLSDGSDTVYYLIEDQYGRQNWGQVIVSKRPN